MHVRRQSRTGPLQEVLLYLVNTDVLSCQAAMRWQRAPVDERLWPCVHMHLAYSPATCGKTPPTGAVRVGCEWSVPGGAGGPVR